MITIASASNNAFYYSTRCLEYKEENRELEYESKSDSEYESKTQSTNRHKCNIEDEANGRAHSETDFSSLKNENEPIIELADDELEVVWWNVSGMALAGCPSAKDVAKIASQKSMEKREESEGEEEEEEESTEEESEEDEDPEIMKEKRQLREVKLLKTKVRNFKLVLFFSNESFFINTYFIPSGCHKCSSL